MKEDLGQMNLLTQENTLKLGINIKRLGAGYLLQILLGSNAIALFGNLC